MATTTQLVQLVVSSTNKTLPASPSQSLIGVLYLLTPTSANHERALSGSASLDTERQLHVRV